MVIHGPNGLLRGRPGEKGFSLGIRYAEILSEKRISETGGGEDFSAQGAVFPSGQACEGHVPVEGGARGKVGGATNANVTFV